MSTEWQTYIVWVARQTQAKPIPFQVVVQAPNRKVAEKVARRNLLHIYGVPHTVTTVRAGV